MKGCVLAEITIQKQQANSENCGPPPSNNFDIEVGQGHKMVQIERACHKDHNAKYRCSIFNISEVFNISGVCDVSKVWATLRWTYSPSLVTVWQHKL